MKRNFNVDLLIILLLFRVGRTERIDGTEVTNLEGDSVAEVSLITLREGGPNYDPYYVQQISLASNSNVTFNVTYIPPGVSFLIFQVHTYQYNVTLSYDKDHLNNVSNSTVFGSNIGLYVRPNGSNMLHMYTKNQNYLTVNALIIVTIYNNKVPIPGGCNMEFDTEIAPYEKVYLKNGMIIVDAQPSSMPENGTQPPNCGNNPVAHDMYQLYLPEQDFSADTYFLHVMKMITVEDIVQNGRKVAASSATSPMRRVFSAYTGVGSVYVTVATYGDYSVAYVPAFTYACNPVVDPDSCELLPDGLTKFICALTFFVGFLSVFQGHKFIQMDAGVPVLFTGTIIGYTISIGSFDSSPQANIGIGLVIGLAITLVWMVFTFIYGRLCSSIIFDVTLGFFLTSIIYFSAPDSFLVLENNLVFWTLFVILTVSFSIVTAVLFTIGSVVGCAILASYMMILSIDYCSGSCLKYIIINVIRRATIPDFRQAAIIPPVQTRDNLLIVLWFLLALYRLWVQWLPCVPCRRIFDKVGDKAPLLGGG